MGLFYKKKNEPSKYECPSCKKEFYEDELDSEGLCKNCESKVQCESCEEYFDELNDNNECKKCEKQRQEEEENEECLCSECGEDFKKKDMTETDDGDFYCKECWNKIEESKGSTLEIIGKGYQKRLVLKRNPARKVFDELKTASSGRIELDLGDDDKLLLNAEDVSFVHLEETDDGIDELRERKTEED